jgi:hypothetical protein
MPIPALLTTGILPPGVHDASLDEIEQAFATRNQHRLALFQNLKRFLDGVRKLNIFDVVYVDGSFTTDKVVPGDIDVVLPVDGPRTIRLLGHPDRADVLDRAAIVSKYGIDVLLAPSMVEFFQKLRPEEAILRKMAPATRRGILRVML